MVNFSNCKINIGLYITGKRTDGYHNIETVFFPVPLHDVLELKESVKTGITILGRSVPGNVEDNIVLKAWQLLKKNFKHLPPIHFYLLKNIPVGAGLGAGSANGACALKALNEKYELHLSTSQLINYALQLGSDCPFFIKNSPCFASGRGENLEEIKINLSNYKLFIVNPGIHISTAWAFGQVAIKQPAYHLQQSIQKPVSEWKQQISNSFESAVFGAHPTIAAIKHQLYQSGAVFASMSGSGSTVYALFKKDMDTFPEFPEDYFVKTLAL